MHTRPPPHSYHANCLFFKKKLDLAPHFKEHRVGIYVALQSSALDLSLLPYPFSCLPQNGWWAYKALRVLPLFCFFFLIYGNLERNDLNEKVDSPLWLLIEMRHTKPPLLSGAWNYASKRAYLAYERACSHCHGKQGTPHVEPIVSASWSRRDEKQNQTRWIPAQVFVWLEMLHYNNDTIGAGALVFAVVGTSLSLYSDFLVDFDAHFHTS